jgi:outer membrane protein assembly factor BamB
MRPVRATALLLAAGLLGCGGGQIHADLFSTNWSDDGGRTIEALRQRIASVRPPAGADIVVGVPVSPTGHKDTLIGTPLGGGAEWKFSHPLSSRPIVASSVVVATGSGELFALDASSGKKLWARPTGGLSLRGAGDDGSVTVVTLGSPTGRGSTLLAVARDGLVKRQVESDQDLGTPATFDGLAFVPWGNEYVSVLDLGDGQEAARVVLREKTSRAWTMGGALYFGEIGLFRFDEHIKDASRNRATHLALPLRELPGSPRLTVGGGDRLDPASGAEDKIRLYARPGAPTGPLSFDDDRFYATYFRLVMGFSAGSGALAWVHTHPSDVIGGAASDGGVVLCDADGNVTVLAAKTGGEVSKRSLGAPLASCVVQVDGFTPAGPPEDVGPLAAQLEKAIENRDLDLATAQRLLLRELGTLNDDDATKTLVEVVSDPRTSPALQGEARTELASRRTGARFMITALARHYDFLKDVLAPPPVGPIAQALGAMNEKSAAPLLASHLLDPVDSSDDVKQAARALVALAGPAEVPILRQFFAMYRDAPDTEGELSDALVSVGQALLKVDGASGRATVDLALSHGLTNASAKEKLKAVVEASDARKAAEGR